MRDLFGKISMVLRTAVLSAGLLLCGCESDDDIEDNEAQRDDIVSFLTGSHSPSLIAESDLGSSYDIDPAFYTTYGDYAFRYIEDFYNSDRATKSVISSGSRVTLTYRLYEFTGSSILSTDLPAYTNDASYKTLYEDAGLSMALWNFSPLTITIGESAELESIHTGLIGCVEGDTIELYMTRNMAYGKDVIGLIEQWASLVFYCEISDVQ